MNHKILCVLLPFLPAVKSKREIKNDELVETAEHSLLRFCGATAFGMLARFLQYNCMESTFLKIVFFTIHLLRHKNEPAAGNEEGEKNSIALRQCNNSGILFFSAEHV